MEYGFYIGFVFRKGLRPDDDVIKVHMAYLADPGSQCIGDSPLVNGWGIFDSHGHDHPFV